jgi:hypothetical protein
VTAAEVIAKAIYDHIWGNDFPTDEADCCAPEVLVALKANGYAVVKVCNAAPGVDYSSCSGDCWGGE